MLLLTPRDSQVFVRFFSSRDHSRTLGTTCHRGPERPQVFVNGRVALEQSNFGFDPFSIPGGALQVQDRVDVRFMIRAGRVPS